MKKLIEQPKAGLAKSKAQAVVPGSTAKAAIAIDEAALLGNLRTLVQSARQRIATAAYFIQTLLCWHMGRRLDSEHLQGARAAYGKQFLVTVSRELTVDYGRGFSHTELTPMVQFAQAFPDMAIVVKLSQQLSWSHFHALLPIKDPLARDFYAEMCRIERWDVRTLWQKIGGMLFQRTALSKRPTSVISAEISNLRDGQMSPDIVFRDPYLLDLLCLKGAYSKRDLESAILRENRGRVAGAGHRLRLRRTAEAHERGQGRLPPGPAVLPPPPAQADCRRVEVGALPACPCRPDGAVPALA